MGLVRLGVALAYCAGILSLRSAAVPLRTDPGWQMPSDQPTAGYHLTNALGGLAFENPVAVTSPPGETNRLFVIERGGRIMVVTNFALPTKSVFIDLSPQLYSSYIEAGLLAMAFHPGFATNGYFYVYRTLFTSTEVEFALHDQLSRFTVLPDNPNRAAVGSELVLISQYDDRETHNGGDLQFGPDGYLYLSLGDEGPARTTSSPNAQPINEGLFGVILRIDVDRRPGNLAPNPYPSSTTNYAIPADNPFIGAVRHQGQYIDASRVRTEIYALGFRNPFRFTFEPLTGRLICGDVGVGMMEEVDIVEPGGNYGFPYTEGTLNYAPPPPETTFIGPVITYRHGNATNEGNAVIGGVFYAGSKIPQLRGAYVFGDNVRGQIWTANLTGASPNGPVSFERLTADPGISSFGRDPRDGELLVINHYSGLVQRLTYHSPANSPAFPLTLADTGLFTKLTSLLPESGLVPYEINVPFWSDGALKRRWFGLPNASSVIQFDPERPWSFPAGTVWVKHFDLELTKGDPSTARRLETRVLVRNAEGIYGVTYRWGGSPTNAMLVPEGGLDEAFVVRDAGVTRTQRWHYPSRVECLSCHSAASGYALGFNTAQLNRDVHYPTETTNQIVALGQAGYFQTNVADPIDWPFLAHATNSIFPVGYRARSYLAANCSHCHQPGGSYTVGANWDARRATPLADAGILGRLLAPYSPTASLLWQRVANLSIPHMPPIATSEADVTGIDLLAEWINSFPEEPWTSTDIGPAYREGIASVTTGTVAIAASGSGITGVQDGFHYLFQPMNGNGLFVAEVRGVFSPNESAQAGLMIRETSMVGARNASLLLSPDRRLAFRSRADTNGYTASEEIDGSTGRSFPYWLQFARHGDVITGQSSADGATWTDSGRIEIALAQDSLVGLAVTARREKSFAEAVFKNVKFLSVILTTPATNSIVTAPGSIEMTAQIRQFGATVSRVEFFANAIKVGELTNAPYTFTWDGVAAGEYPLTVKVTESSGSSIASQPVNVTVLPAKSFAAFVRSDETIAGNWIGRFGQGGYVIIGDATNLSSFAVLNVVGHGNQIWNASPSESRALQRVTGPQRIAANWNSATNFSIDLVLRRGLLRRITLYFLDWDTAGERTQTVEILDAASNEVLDRQTVSAFADGKYLIWSVRGQVQIRVTASGAQSAVVSGLFLDPDPNRVPTVALVSPTAGSSNSIPAAIVLNATASDADGSIRSVEFLANGTSLGQAETPPYTVNWTNALAGSYYLSARAMDNLGTTAESQPVYFTLTLPSAHAGFVSVNKNVRGDWVGHFGSDGFVVVNHATNLSSRLDVSVAGGQPYTWAEASSELRALERLQNHGRIAAAWVGENFFVPVAERTGRRERVTFYLLDWDTGARQVQIDALDAVTGQVLDSRQFSGFVEGHYVTWSIEGPVQFRFTTLRGPNAVVSGVFFDEETNVPPAILLTQPESGLQLPAPVLVKLGASASSPDGIRKVEFFANGLSIGEVTREPYEWTWSMLSGTYDIFARAIANSGIAQRSQHVSFWVRPIKADASFAGFDTNTAGAWKAGYGREGYALAGHATNSLFSAPFTLIAEHSYPWSIFTTDPRGLEFADSIGRFAAGWVAGPTSSIQVEADLRDGRYHQAALYCLDWDQRDRLEHISLFDADDGRLLDSRSISNFYDGRYARWNIRGHVRFVTSSTTPPNAAVSGFFIDPVPGSFDEWKHARFTPAGATDPILSGDAADPDGDGLDNLMEYFLGLDPLSADPQGRPEVRVIDDRLTLTFRRAKGAKFITSLVEVSPDLAGWSARVDDVQKTQTDDLGDFERVTYQATARVSAHGVGFVRLRLYRY